MLTLETLTEPQPGTPQHWLRAALLRRSGVAFDAELARQQLETHNHADTPADSGDAQPILGISWHGARLLFDALEQPLKLDGLPEELRAATLPQATTTAGSEQSHAPAAAAADGDERHAARQLFDIRTSATGMGWLVAHFVAPCTQAAQMPLLAHFFGLRFLSFAVVGPARVFHSYTWRERIADTIATLDRALPTDRQRITHFLWWDIFCQNQHVKGDVARTFQVGRASSLAPRCVLLGRSIAPPLR